MTQPRRTHRLTPLLQGIPAVPIAIAFLLGPGNSLLDGRRAVLAAAAFALIGYVVLAAVSWVIWSRRTYWLDADGDLRVDSGLLQRSSRRLQLSRLQSVDVVAPFLARVAGLVEVRVEVAGASGSHVVLRYLTRADAEDLRRSILGLAQGGEPGAAQDTGEETDAPEVLAEVPQGRLVGALLMRSVTAGLLVLSALLLVLTAVTQGPAGLLLALITGGLPILSVVGEFMSNYGFRVTRTREGLRIRHGLLSTKTRTLPPDRVHAVALVAPLLWRRWDWVRITVTIAGVEGDGDRAGPQVLIPVAPRAQALALIAEVLPGVDVEALPFSSSPAASRWRAPFAWRTLAIALTPDVIAARYGRITSHIAIAPHNHVQSVRVTQGPWERRLGLASLHADTAPGPVDVVGKHLALDAVRPLADREAGLMRMTRGRP